jgi:hypothetical protein
MKMSKYQNAYRLYDTASEAVRNKRWKAAQMSLMMLIPELDKLDHADGMYAFGQMYLFGAPEGVRELVENFHEALIVAKDPKRKAKRINERNAKAPQAAAGSKSCVS